MPMPMLRCATLVVADVDATVERYGEWLDYCLVERGTVAAEQAAAWGPGVSGAAVGNMWLRFRDTGFSSIH